MKLQQKLIFILAALLAAVLPAFHIALAEQEVSIKGEIELKLRRNEQIEIKGAAALDKAVAKKEGSGWVLRDKTGTEIARVESGSEGVLTFKDAKGEPRYTLEHSGATYHIRRPTDKSLVNRVKIKEDKFNVYDSEANRLRHGKQKPDGFGVKDQKGKQILKIKGTTSLEETSYLAVPIETEYRVLAWAAHSS